MQAASHNPGVPAVAGQQHVFLMIEVGTRHVHVFDVTAQPGDAWTVQQGRNLLMALEKRAIRFLIRELAARFTEACDAVLAGAVIEIAKILPRRAR